MAGTRKVIRTSLQYEQLRRRAGREAPSRNSRRPTSGRKEHELGMKARRSKFSIAPGGSAGEQVLRSYKSKRRMPLGHTG